MSGVLRWAEPPNRRQSKAARWAPVADALRKRPGDWAVIEESTDQTKLSGTVNYIKKGDGPFAPIGAFEALSRTERGPDGRTGRTTMVYARYVGGAQ